MTDVSSTLSRSQTESTEKLLTNLRQDLSALATQGNAMVDATEKSTAVQEERMSDVRRQNMMIMDMLSNAQESMHTSAESLQSFTRSEIMRDSATNMEMQLREVIIGQMTRMQEALLGEGEDGGRGGSFKAAVNRMVDRLEEASTRLEVASAPNSAAAMQGSAEMEELIRREMAAVAMALSQQSREAAQESLMQVEQTVRMELLPLKDATVSATGVMNAKMAELNSSMSNSMSRFEDGVEKVLQTVEYASAGKSESKRGGGRADRG
mmetsp:Transcript_43840/g.78745  ORF Transcript_43840/g.78745 Transcript_43840/m.78745 type:complete len:266 (-) Transcript_43840:69-866(-)